VLSSWKWFLAHDDGKPIILIGDTAAIIDSQSVKAAETVGTTKPWSSGRWPSP
jgi:hypothetical protein